MEQDVAIMMADLSGYTALTETHGAASAADLIDKYISIAENCLTGDTKLHERTGDEIMFVSDSPDSLLATALKLAATTSSEENFLQIHGGLHYGKLLKRDNNYFGSALNLVSRVAATAVAGSFCCTDEFLNSITDRSVCDFKSRGHLQFKNINGEKEVFELALPKTKANYIDPVCRMLILNPQHAIHHANQEELYFCSSQCLGVYSKNHFPLETLDNRN